MWFKECLAWLLSSMNLGEAPTIANIAPDTGSITTIPIWIVVFSFLTESIKFLFFFNFIATSSLLLLVEDLYSGCFLIAFEIISDSNFLFLFQFHFLSNFC